MKRSITSLIGYSIKAIDGEIGKIRELFFDDETWTIRFLIVKTGNWLTGRKVLISPQALLAPDWEKENFEVNLTMEQIRNSPEIDTEKPVSRQQEIKLYEHYKWQFYWRGAFHSTGIKRQIKYGLRGDEDFQAAIKSSRSNLLHSTRKVIGYTMNAVDGVIGRVEDFIFNDRNWELDFLVVDMGNWHPGEKVIISPKRIREVKWDASAFTVNTMVELVKDSPEYHPDMPIGEIYEADLENHYDGYVCHKR